ncbi:MAG: universal stress protein [Alphaproteobacteria bacterium]|nr:universal stress protein [Alphaproteobacteria bacterium]MCB9931506.1 universal stress protein [Alphaproteobacteria bacterium]
MFQKIMVPVDLAHAARMERATATAADLAKLYGAAVVYVGVTTSAPSAIAHTPQEYAGKLKSFAADQAARHGHSATSHAMVSHDPSIDLDETLMRGIDETGADLVVMASHIPNVTDHFWPSNGGRIASHAKSSVFIVRMA